jgi:predicted dehydrogenase
VRFAVLGCGVIGAQHARAISDLGDQAQLVLAVDPVPASARRLAEVHGIEAETEVAAALARPDIDAVAICTPSGSHADLAIASLRAGKHVVVEKPVDVTVEAADRLLEAERSTGRRITVISQHRFDESSRLVHHAVVDGRFGTLTSGVASVAWWRSQAYYDSGQWRGTLRWDGGGAVMNQSIHTVDLLIWMLGEPIEVYAVTARLAHTGIEVEDTCVATIRFASGALGTVHATTAAYPGLTARLQIHGSAGSAVIDDDRLVYFSTAVPGGAGGGVPGGAGGGVPGGAGAGVPGCAGGGVPGGVGGGVPGGAGGGGDGSGVEADERAGTGSTAAADPAALSDAHTAQYRDFVDAVLTGRTPFVTVADARRTLAVVTAMYASAAAGKPIRLG